MMQNPLLFSDRLPTVALLAGLLLAAGCAATLPKNVTPMDGAVLAFAEGDFESASRWAGRVADDTDAGLPVRAEAAWIAAEADLARGEDVKALRRYRWILENAPWSESVGMIEDRLFELGEIFFHDPRHESWFFGSRNRGVEAFETLQAHFRRSDRADDALKAVGDYFVSEKDWYQAGLTFEELWEEYPDSEWSEYALWMAGHTRWEASQGADYDRDEMLRAKALLEVSLTTHPRGVASKQAEADLVHVIEALAWNEVIVADFYSARGSSVGERLRLANAALLYPETEAGMLAAARLDAMGLDLASLRKDLAASALDNVKPGLRRFEDDRRSVFGFGY